MSEGKLGLRLSEVATIVVFAIIFGVIFGTAYAWLNIGAWLKIGQIGLGIIVGGMVGALAAIYLRWSRRRRNDLTGS